MDDARSPGLVVTMSGLMHTRSDLKAMDPLVCRQKMISAEFVHIVQH